MDSTLRGMASGDVFVPIPVTTHLSGIMAASGALPAGHARHIFSAEPSSQLSAQATLVFRWLLKTTERLQLI